MSKKTSEILTNTYEAKLDLDNMEDEKNTNLEKIMKLLVIILVASLVFTAGLGTYSLVTYQKASPVILETANTYNYIEEDKWYLFSTNNNNDNKAIFLYPKAKIDEHAYFYLAHMLQRRGYDVFIAKSRFHQPLFSLSFIDKAMEKYPKYQAWFVGGHGNAADAVNRYAQGGNLEKIKGVFYLGGLPDKKIIESKMPIFVALGSEDTIFDWEKFETNKDAYYAQQIELQIIAGGNHTNFGYYDNPSRDTVALITPKEQQDIVANRLDKFIIINS